MIVVDTQAVVPGAVMRCRIVGVPLMADEKGSDEKLIAVAARRLTRRFHDVTPPTDLPQMARDQLGRFFGHDKDLEPGGWVKALGWGDADEGRRMLLEAIARHQRARQDA